MSESLNKCIRCGKVLISEEYDSHLCSPAINGKISVIEVDYWIQGKHPETGEDLISTKGLDGTTYWLVRRSKKDSDKQPYCLPPHNEQPYLNNRRRNTTKIMVVFASWLLLLGCSALVGKSLNHEEPLNPVNPAFLPVATFAYTT